MFTDMYGFSEQCFSVSNKLKKQEELLDLDLQNKLRLKVLALQSKHSAHFKAFLDDSLITVDTTSLDQHIQQLLNEAEQDMKNSADQGGCYPQRLKAEVDNTLRDLQNSSYPTKAEFNNCFIIHSKYF